MQLVRYNAKNVYYCANVKLLPGLNTIEGVFLEKALEHPLFKKRINDGIIEIIKTDKRKKNQGLESAMVDEINDISLLKDLAKNDNDEIGVKAQQRLEKINNLEEVE